MSSSNNSSALNDTTSGQSFEKLPIVDLSIYCFLTSLAIANFALTVRYRNALGLSKFFTGVMIAASISWIVCCLSYIPYDVSVTDLSTFTGDNGQQVLRFLNFLNDVTFIGSFMLYQFCTIYEFGYVAGFAPVGKISQKVLACLATVVYSCGFFWLHPWIDWCYWTTCEIMPILNQDVYVYYDTTAELVYSFIDIFLGIMVFYVVSKINPKPSNSHKYFELKSRTLKFSVSWSLIALGSYILMIISLCIPPANSDSFVDFPAIFHDSSRIMVSLEFMWSIYFMLLMKQWIQFAESNGHEDAGSMILVKQDIVTAATDNHKQILATTELNADSALEV